MIFGAFVETAKIILNSVCDHAVQMVSSGVRFKWLSKKYDILLTTRFLYEL
jgi:hypothetical protein